MQLGSVSGSEVHTASISKDQIQKQIRASEDHDRPGVRWDTALELRLTWLKLHLQL